MMNECDGVIVFVELTAVSSYESVQGTSLSVASICPHLQPSLVVFPCSFSSSDVQSEIMPHERLQLFSTRYDLYRDFKMTKAKQNPLANQGEWHIPYSLIHTRMP